ncbi:short-chain dehydrogenase/reductase [Saccharopolyspora phatthalungensis]|uniref:NAD(P)-dependent dehydrogenase (Short-subunit alcohol dehydrogenase family) n=1 Tax=Saccharopolyspora phatthalungensis TaxID=664693 RepID=A0A840QA96_9PSEU|nr:short-chain dehydrogenase/reductase [Saccharopolyspora phatthalungensis]MBB5157336.1 NAD(P)-dependent dehydrogenase (short-subunit alcohol dehydrogenase family) [Saccharopolyspora phatthalungensis]
MDLCYTAGQSVLVTGGSRGIGAATVRAFAAEGVGRIHVAARDSESVARLSREVKGTEVVGHVLDLSRSGDRGQLSSVLDEVDILVNNAGAIPQGALEAADLAAWRRAWDLKVWGYLELTQLALAAMTERGTGVVVNVVGVSGERPDVGYLAGSMANSALMTLTRTVGAYSLDHGVRVVGVNPGPVETSRLTDALRTRAATEFGDSGRWADYVRSYPAQRIATAEEVADTVVFLASARSGYTSGCIVTLDGGMAWRGRAL